MRTRGTYVSVSVWAVQYSISNTAGGGGPFQPLSRAHRALKTQLFFEAFIFSLANALAG